MQVRWYRLVGVALAATSLFVASACTSSSGGGDSASGEISVWDYYGDTTPIKPAVEAFQKENPSIKVNYEMIDYETIQDKFTTSVSSGNAPDVVTLDMTWIPTYAANGMLADLSDLSGNQINGQPIDKLYAAGALDAMRYDGKYITAMYDFDAYALYYRADLLAAKGVQVPTTWQQLAAATKAIGTDADGDGKLDHQLFQVLPDTFHYAQFLFQAGGTILDSDNKRATFDGQAGVKALQAYKDLLATGGIYWGTDQGDTSGIDGIKDGRIAMFLNGPYMMGILKDSAPELSGKWKVAAAPTDGKPGSYLGGTGLSIPVNAKHKDAAWKFVQFLLRPEQQLNVAKYAGAGPATTAALQSSELTKPDPYFGNQAPFGVFLETMATATHFPYIKQWSDIDTALTDAVTAALLGTKTPQQALSDAAQEVNSSLAN